MARNNKKSKRPNLPQETLERARAELRGESLDAVTTADSEAVSAPRKVSTPATTAAVAPKRRRVDGSGLASRRVPTIQELIEEYGYVLHDLRKLAILAALLLIIIGIASVVFAHAIG
jgi:hypothetical protein